MKEISYTLIVNRFLTRGRSEPPDILARHHPQCYVKTKRETEGDEGGGGEQNETEGEKKRGGGGGGRLGTLDISAVLSIEVVVRDLRGPNNSCRSLLQTLTYLEPPVTSWVTQCKHALSQMTQPFRHEAKRQKAELIAPAESAQVCLFSNVKQRFTTRTSISQKACGPEERSSSLPTIYSFPDLRTYSMYHLAYVCGRTTNPNVIPCP